MNELVNKESQELSNEWSDKLQALAKDYALEEEKLITAPYISTMGGRFSFQKSELPNPLKVVILDSVFDNAFYERAFSPDQYQAPVCFAINKIMDELQPHEYAPKPQSEFCKPCPKNQYGSTPSGGKACRNYRRLLVMHANDVEDLGGGEENLALLNISPTSMAIYSKYAYHLFNAVKRPVFSVITSISLGQRGGKSYNSFSFSMERMINDDMQLDRLLEIKENSQNLLLLPYPVQKSESKIEDESAHLDTDKF
jgi:hypothetical protein